MDKHKNNLPQLDGHLHFVGIGGIGMSGIAEILHTLGYAVQGSDLAMGGNVQRLQDLGIRVSNGHEAAYINDAKGNAPAAVVISSAIKAGNVELEAARSGNIPVVRRAEMLAELMRMKRAMAVGGTHGKTTTTSMIGQLLETAEFDPTVINGGIVNAYGTNTRLGQSEWMVVEADESDGTFTRLPADVAVVTNMDPEHMEHYGNFEEVKKAYLQFIHNVPFYGYVVLCIDHPEVQALIPSVMDRVVVTYGFNPQADVRASNVRSDARGSVFDVEFSARLCADGKALKLRDVFMPMPGIHNVQNSLAALAIAQKKAVPAATMKKALEGFTGVKRRFTHVGAAEGITVIDDYAHHPVEIETVLKTARVSVEAAGGQVIAVMQPHRYSRLQDLFEEFCTCFNEADHVIVADVYEAGEKPIKGADKDALVSGIRNHGHRSVQALGARADLAWAVAEVAQEGDYVICLGAGDITRWAAALPEELAKEIKKRKGIAA